MSENKTQEELFLSENKEENLKIREIDVLLISDIHKSYGYLEKLKEWLLENKKLFNYIFATGDFLNMDSKLNEMNEEVAKGEAELSSIISYLENMCLNVIYIGGNHDPVTLFNTEGPTLSIRSINLHKNHFKLANDLYVIGIGGALPGITSHYDITDPNFIPFGDVSNKLAWEGFPYNETSYHSADKAYLNDLEIMMNNYKTHIEENNTTPNIKVVLLTHNGPFYSNTAASEFDSKMIYSGSQNLQKFLQKNNKEIFINIHGHTHQGKGNILSSGVNIINPGPLTCGNFAILKLKRNFNDEWIIGKIEQISLV